jgi:hypothetical protein
MNPRYHKRKIASLLSLAILSIGIGLASGLILRSNTHESFAASANITVSNNDQVTADTIYSRDSGMTVRCVFYSEN